MLIRQCNQIAISAIADAGAAVGPRRARQLEIDKRDGCSEPDRQCNRRGAKACWLGFASPCHLQQYCEQFGRIYVVVNYQNAVQTGGYGRRPVGGLRSRQYTPPRGRDAFNSRDIEFVSTHWPRPRYQPADSFLTATV